MIYLTGTLWSLLGLQDDSDFALRLRDPGDTNWAC